MEIIKCEKGRIILLMTKNDMEKYQIGKGEAQTVEKKLRIILNDTEVKEEFRGWCRLLVKIFESKEGGCELFITRLSGETPPVTYCINPIRYIYRFPGTAELLSACKAISNTGFDGESDIFYDENCVYLIIDRKFENLSEFDAVECRMSLGMYIEEHCTRLLKGNVSTLAELI